MTKNSKIKMANFYNLLKFLKNKRPKYDLPLVAKLKYEKDFDRMGYITQKGRDLKEKEMEELLKTSKNQKEKDSLSMHIISSKGDSLSTKELISMMMQDAKKEGILRTVEKFSKMSPEKVNEAIDNDDVLNLLLRKNGQISTEELENFLMKNEWGDNFRTALVQIRKDSMSEKDFRKILNHPDDPVKVASYIVDVMGDNFSKGDFRGVKSIFLYGMHSMEKLEPVIKKMLEYTTVSELTGYLESQGMNRAAHNVQSYARIRSYM